MSTSSKLWFYQHKPFHFIDFRQTPALNNLLRVSFKNKVLTFLKCWWENSIECWIYTRECNQTCFKTSVENLNVSIYFLHKFLRFVFWNAVFTHPFSFKIIYLFITIFVISFCILRDRFLKRTISRECSS